ncbi:MAG: ATP-binding cassette domain-containing protein, partial [Myxococcota bacterium]
RFMALISFAGVKKAFGPKIVYRGFDLEVRRGEVLTIIGGSGQGKSVMLKMLIGLLTVDEGTITFDGEVISGGDEASFASVRRRIAMLFQGAALFDSLSVGENVAYGLEEQRADSKFIQGRVQESLGFVGMEGSEGLWPAELSSGMKKRVGLARAIAMRPEVLLYDEPTTGLDPINVQRIIELILHLQRNLDVTSIVVTHDMHSALSISDRIAMIHGGYVIFSGTPSELMASEDARVRDFVEGNAPEDEDTETLLRSAG